MKRYYAIVLFPSGYSYKVEILPYEITNIKIKVEYENFCLKQIQIPISFDGIDNNSQVCSIKIKDSD